MFYVLFGKSSILRLVSSILKGSVPFTPKIIRVILRLDKTGFAVIAALNNMIRKKGAGGIIF